MPVLLLAPVHAPLIPVPSEVVRRTGTYLTLSTTSSSASLTIPLVSSFPCVFPSACVTVGSVCVCCVALCPLRDACAGCTSLARVSLQFYNTGRLPIVFNCQPPRQLHLLSARPTASSTRLLPQLFPEALEWTGYQTRLRPMDRRTGRLVEVQTLSGGLTRNSTSTMNVARRSILTTTICPQLTIISATSTVKPKKRSLVG